MNVLLYPFKWGNIYIPTLPRHLLDYIHSPTPFLIGLSTSYASEVSDGKEFICVDLDKGTVQLRPGSEIPSLPQSQQEKLIDDLSEFSMREIDVMDSFHWKPWLTKQITDEEFNFGVRAAFLRFFCFLMQDYRKYTLYIRMFCKTCC